MKFAAGLFLGMGIAYRDVGGIWAGPACYALLIGIAILVANAATLHRSRW